MICLDTTYIIIHLYVIHISVHTLLCTSRDTVLVEITHETWMDALPKLLQTRKGSFWTESSRQNMWVKKALS